MNKHTLYSIILCFLFMFSTWAGAESCSLPGCNDSIVASLTDKEKAQLVVGEGWQQMFAAFNLASASKVKVPGAAGCTRAIERLGIPSLVLSDGPTGVRIAPHRKGDTCDYHQTAFPSPILLASSFDTSLVRRVGQAIGWEARRAGVDVMLAPGMNLQTYPLCGRSFEYYSTDPYLSGHIAAAMIRGIQQEGVGACAKHFAGNDREDNRMHRSTDLDSITLHDRYLKNFRYALEADPWCVMSAYNALNGVPCRENAWLLDTLLRQEWNYEGVVMTDWWFRHHPVQQHKAGNDLLMPGSKMQVNDIRRAIRRGKCHPNHNNAISSARIDSAVSRVLRLIQKTQAPAPHAEAPCDVKTICRAAAAESIVLIKNENNTLPLAPRTDGAPRTISLYGCSGYEPICCGTGSGYVSYAHAVSPAEGLQEAGFLLQPDLRTAYTDHINNRRNRINPGQFGPISRFTSAPCYREMEVDSTFIPMHALSTHAAVVCIGRQAGEAKDRDMSDYRITNLELALIRQVAEAFHRDDKPVIVVLNVVGPIETDSWRDYVDAIVLTWAPGQEGGHALTDIITGKINPSGRLPIALSPYDSESFPFGHGLCYTTFREEETAEGLRVTNIGTTAGKHVVLQYDADGYLTCFHKTPLLQPGESEEIIRIED